MRSEIQEDRFVSATVAEVREVVRICHRLQSSTAGSYNQVCQRPLLATAWTCFCIA